MKTILVVDDDADEAEIIAYALAGQGWRVRAFSDPLRALAAFEQEDQAPPDLLIVDLSMPWMHGSEFIHEVHQRSPRSKLFLISAYEEGVSFAQRAGIPFFAKPVDPSLLRAAAAEALCDETAAEPLHPE